MSALNETKKLFRTSSSRFLPLQSPCPPIPSKTKSERTILIARKVVLGPLAGRGPRARVLNQKRVVAADDAEEA